MSIDIKLPGQKRVTALLTSETYAGLLVLKHLSGRTLGQLVELACAKLIAAEAPVNEETTS